MSHPIDLTAPETLTDEDLAQVAGGLTLRELIAHPPDFGVQVVPAPGLGSYVTRIAVSMGNPGPTLTPSQYANDPRNFIFIDE